MEDVKGMWYTMNEEYRAWGALKSVLNNRGLWIKVNKCLYEGVIVPTALYRAEACGTYEKCCENKGECSWDEALRTLVGVSRMVTVRNKEGRRRAGIERELASRADQRVFRWFGHVERKDEYRMARLVLMAEASGGRVRGKPKLGWMDGVKVALCNRGMMMEAARQCVKDRKEWKALVHM